jgi:hypothetical protein
MARRTEEGEAWETLLQLLALNLTKYRRAEAGGRPFAARGEGKREVKNRQQEMIVVREQN